MQTTTMRGKDVRTGLDATGALCGRYGDVIYADLITARLYAALRPEAKIRVRAMYETQYQGGEDLSACDFEDLSIAHATMRIGDSVARSVVVFGPLLAEEARVVVDGQDARIPGILPETIKAAIMRSDLGELTGHALLAGCKVILLSEEDGRTVLRHDSLPVHIHDAPAAPVVPARDYGQSA